MTANRTGMDLADLELLEASIGRAHAEGLQLGPSAALASDGSPSSPLISSSAASPRRSDRPERRRSRLRGSDDEVSVPAEALQLRARRASEGDDAGARWSSESEGPRRSRRPARERSDDELDDELDVPSASDDYNFYASSDSDHGGTDDVADVPAWSWLDAEEEFPGIIEMGLTDDDPETEERDWDGEHSDECATDNEWEEGDEPYLAPEPAAGLSRRARIRAGHDPEKTSLWTARNKNKMSDATKRRFAVSKKGIEAAVRFRCPCGYETSGSFCVDRIQLRAETVLQERCATFAARLHGKGRLRLHATRLKPNVQDVRRLTSERFSGLQRPEKYHWFIQGRPVCKETYAEVCALGEQCMQAICSLAISAKDGFLDLSQAEPRRCIVRDAEADGRECALVSYMDTLARGCCDAIPNGDTVDALASDPEYGRDDDDGGVEWKLPFRSAYFVWQMYVQAVELPYSYPRFIVKWSQLCPHIKRAGNTLLRCCANVGWTGMSVQLEFVLLCDCC